MVSLAVRENACIPGHALRPRPAHHRAHREGLATRERLHVKHPSPRGLVYYGGRSDRAKTSVEGLRAGG